MELGQRIRAARLEKGLSQRQLCGDTITRNMLSLIENGSAKPSMDTLCTLAARLDKPVGYFLEETTVFSPNQTLILQARTATPEAVLEILKAYQKPDPLFDPEYGLLIARACMSLAKQAITENRTLLATNFLEQAAQAGATSIYYTPELETKRLLLCHQVKAAAAPVLAAQLPDNTDDLMLRAQAALETDDYPRCAALLDSCIHRNAHWQLLRGEVCLRQHQYAQAIPYFQQAEKTLAAAVYPQLEQCFRELEDYKQAYEYACKQK